MVPGAGRSLLLSPGDGETTPDGRQETKLPPGLRRELSGEYSAAVEGRAGSVGDSGISPKVPTGHAAPTGRYLALLSLTALGIVFGDIGTSPLYALRECFSGPHALPVTPLNILGILSLVFWSLILVISVKYLALVLKADSRGEGGILVLMSLIRKPDGATSRRRGGLVILGLFGACLLYGDSVITPAITVLSAVEGIEVATPAFHNLVIPLSLVILVVLFFIQKWGTAGVGKLFGPVMLLWFAVLAATGLNQILKAPRVLLAVDPLYAVRFFAADGLVGFLVLGSVFLCVTGGEALYADMGHFGARPIRIVWFALVLPSLLLNYFGQGALLLTDPKAADNPFFRITPAWGVVPMVILATMASVIASQAVISGAFSLTRQAIQLGYLPRLRVDHTSAREMGQIYVPAVNWILMVACLWIVVAFKTSSSLANAYGMAVTSTMAITTVLLYVHARDAWSVKPWAALAAAGAFLAVDLAFFGANLVKILHGGWFPLAVAAVIYLLMATWKSGRGILAQRLAEGTLPIDLFISSIATRGPIRVKGTAVFMDRTADMVPPALLHNLKHNKILHERVVFLTVVTDEVPLVRPRDRVEVKNLGPSFWRVTLHYGFMQDVDVPRALRKVRLDGQGFDPMDTTFFLSRETIISTPRPGMAPWREKLFAWMARAHGRATAFFGIPPGRVVELGLQVEI